MGGGGVLVATRLGHRLVDTFDVLAEELGRVFVDGGGGGGHRVQHGRFVAVGVRYFVARLYKIYSLKYCLLVAHCLRILNCVRYFFIYLNRL